MAVKIKHKPNPAFKAAMADLKKPLQARVGWLEGNSYEDGTPVAYVAAIQEFGSPQNSIPSRSFMRSTIAEKQGEWKEAIRGYAKKVVNGKATVAQAMEGLAQLSEGDIRRKISRVTDPPLSPVTIQLRAWKKKGMKISGKTVGWAAYLVKMGLNDQGGASTKPLNDTGYMLATLTSVVEPKE